MMSVPHEAWRQRLGTCVCVLVAVCLFSAQFLAGRALAAFSDYGIESAAVTLSTLEAGRHPDLTTELNFKLDPSGPFGPQPFADTKDVTVELPPGLTANPARFPTCPFAKFVASAASFFAPPCAQDSQIGVVEVQTPETLIYAPLYSLPAPESEVARLGFIARLVPVYLDVNLRSGTDYGVTVRAEGIEGLLPINSIRTKTWGVPADPSHDAERYTPLEGLLCAGTPCQVGGTRSSGLSTVPFLTNPSSCGSAEVNFKTTAYQLPGQLFEASASPGDITNCDRVPFEPALTLSPTSREAGAPTGLEATLTLPDEEASNTINTSALRSAKVMLPEGMVINPSAAEGLLGCSVEQVGFKSEMEADCPARAKLGSLEVVSPALKRPIQGDLFLRTPEPGHLFRFWLVSDELGVHLKVPANVELDPSTGRLTTVITESPQLPAERVVLRFNGGPRAPIRNPEACGKLDARYEFGPWSGTPPVTGLAPLVIDERCGPRGFHPKLTAGTASPVAGSFSSFVLDIAREQGEEDMADLNVTLPHGLLAKLAGVTVCADAAASSGACAEASRVGVVRVAVGSGSLPLWVPQPGKEPTAVYLAGPYNGAPYSLVAKVPAQAGPFDLGIVTVRSAISVDPETAVASVRSDQFPQILQGVPIDYRDVRVELNREEFVLNPTSCAKKRIEATTDSVGGKVAQLTERFQAADCAALGFSPSLILQLKGGTGRGAHPSLSAIMKPKPGDSNLQKVSVALPHSEFLEQSHIRTVCTRVQFRANACPKASIYGFATAITPLLDQPLRGPVYLRSSSHPLPDLVADLRGQIQITLTGRIDSVHGGLRTTFENIPDAPVSKFILRMQGGKKSLLVNSRNICRAHYRASARFNGQNGRSYAPKIALKNSCSA